MPAQFNKKDTYQVTITFSEDVLSTTQHRQLFRILNAENKPAEKIYDEHNSETSLLEDNKKFVTTSK